VGSLVCHATGVVNTRAQEVVGWRQLDAFGAYQERQVLQVVVAIGDQHLENQPPVERARTAIHGAHPGLDAVEVPAWTLKL
jgi:hypothetical protein